MATISSELETNKPKISGSGLDVYLRLLTYVRPYIGYFLLSIFGYILFAASQPALAKVMEILVDAIEEKDVNARYYIPALLLGIYFFRGIGTYLGSYFMALVGNRMVIDLREALFNHIVQLPVSFYDHNDSARLSSRISYNTGMVTGAATEATRTLAREGFTVIGLLAYAFYLNWKLSLTFVAIAPLIGLIVVVVGKRLRRLSTKLQDSMATINQISIDTLSNNRTVKSHTTEAFEMRRFHTANYKNLSQQMKIVLTEALNTPIMQFVVVGAMAFIVYLVLAPAFLQEMSTGMYMSYITTIGLIPKSLKQLSGVNALIQKGIAAAISVFEILDTDKEADSGTTPLERAKGNIKLENVCFTYLGGEKPAIDEVSFEVSPGEIVALVGKSGSGKSTIAALLCRYYVDFEGSILLDNTDIREFRLKDYRSNIGMVDQNIVLFNGTVSENIRYGLSATDVSQNQIEHAADMAFASEFIDELPNGYDTIIGEDGVALSGGQKQRIAIARTLLRDPPILILDEATSALDNESERSIQKALEKIQSTRTTIVIAHRLSTIVAANLILVMSNGKIIERGTHNELLQSSSYYKKLYENNFE